MSVEVFIGLAGVFVTCLGVLNVWLMYFYKSKAQREKEDLLNLEKRSENKMSELSHSCETLNLRVLTLEKHSITEAKTKELIDIAVKPIHDHLDEIKQDGKEAQRDIKALLVGFSNLLGQLGQKPSDINQ